MAPLTVDDARRFALFSSDLWNEIHHNMDSSIVSFRNAETDARMDVHYLMGIVSTTLEHPQKGFTTLTRDGVTLAVLEKLFENPREHTGLGSYNKEGKKKVPHQLSRRRALGAPESESVELMNHLAYMNAKIERAESYLALLIAGKNASTKEDNVQDLTNVQAAERLEERFIILLGMEPLKEKEEKHLVSGSVEAEELVSEDLVLGKDGQDMTFFCDSEIGSFFQRIEPAQVHLFAGLPDGGLLVTNLDGTSRWNGSLTRKLEIALGSRSCRHCLPKVISVGNNDRFFIKFANGTQVYPNVGVLKNLIGSKEGFVRMVAFGEFKNSHAVLYGDGTVSYQNVPAELEQELQSCKQKVEYISLGSFGQYFLRFCDGSYLVGGVGKKKLKLLGRIEGKIREVVFGGTNVFALHDKRFKSLLGFEGMRHYKL